VDRVEIVLKYFPGLSDEQLHRIELLGPLYSNWNKKINLISRKDINALYERHILHSLSIAKFIHFRPGTKVMDVGTGGGFPGIPLAIYFPEVEFTLVDSVQKKIKALENIAEELNLENVRIKCERVESSDEKVDFITSRAVTKITTFYTWTKSKIISSFTNEIHNGILYLKGGDLTEELQGFNSHYELVDLKIYFREPFYETKKLLYIPFTK
jgi:16S rRNA (guanine527-N7)-methyltransferase